MKKLIFALCFALVSLCGMARNEGDMAVGAHIGVHPVLNDNVNVTNFGFGLKFQYNVNEPVRLEAAFDYLFRDNGVDAITLAVNAHYIADLGNNFSIYPVVGLGYGNVGGLAYEIKNFGQPGMTVESKSLNRFLFNIGVGAEYELNSSISLGMEFKYRYMKDFSALPLTLGVTYHF